MHEPLYDEMWRAEEQHWWFLGRRHVVQQLVRAYRPASPGERLSVCDLGCGCGANLAQWQQAHEVTGLDCSERALAYARQRLGSRVFWGRLPDAVPFRPGSFDVVLLTDVLEHVEDDAAAAQRALELLRPGGIVLATVPAYPWLYGPRDRQHHHFRRYGESQFRRLFEVPGMALEFCSYYNTWLFAPALVARLWAKCLGATRARGDLGFPPRPINALLRAIFASEAMLLRKVRLPFGLSLIAVARRQAALSQAA